MSFGPVNLMTYADEVRCLTSPVASDTPGAPPRAVSAGFSYSGSIGLYTHSRGGAPYPGVESPHRPDPGLDPGVM